MTVLGRSGPARGLLLMLAVVAVTGLAAPVAAMAGDRPTGWHPAGDGLGSTITPQVASARLTASRPAGVQGMDVSSHQGAVDWAAAHHAGARFAYVKATESTTYVNPYFGQQYHGSRSAGMVRGAYHFALPDRSSGTAQADFFVRHGGGWSADGWTLPPLLDIEYNPYGPTCFGLSHQAMSSWIRGFVREVRARTGRNPMIFTTTGWWDRCTGSNSTFGVSYPLFKSHWGSTPGPMPAGWKSFVLWQYSSSGTFPGDQDVFPGTTTGLHRFAKGSA